MNTNTIKRAQIRYYSDNKQTKAYITWSDGDRTEGDPTNGHMQALLRCARRESLTIENETW